MNEDETLPLRRAHERRTPHTRLSAAFRLFIHGTRTDGSMSSTFAGACACAFAGFTTLALYRRINAEFQHEEPLALHLVYLLNVLVSTWTAAFVVSVRTGRRRAAFAAALALFLTLFITLFILRGSYVGWSEDVLDVSAFDVHVLSVDTPAGKCRRVPLEAQLVRHGIPYRVTLGTNYRDHNSTQAMIDAAGMHGLEDGALFDSLRAKYRVDDLVNPRSVKGLAELVTLLTARKILIDALASNSGQRYVLILEDDAELPDDFDGRLANAARRFADYDLVWLDTRNTMSWAVFGEPASGSVGMLFNVRTVAKSISEMSLTSETSVELLSEKKQPLFDVGLIRACVRRRIRCACAPILREQKVKSSIDYKYKSG